MTVLFALYTFASGVLLGAAVVLLALHLRSTFPVKPSLSLVGANGTITAQVPPSPATSDYPYTPFYPSAEEEARLGAKQEENAPNHEPLEASRR